jgi:integrase
MTTSRSRPRSWAASNLEADRSWSRITLRPGAIRAGVIRKKDGISFGPNGEVAKRFGFHTLRHSLASCLRYEQENPAVVQAIMRHSKMDMTLDYSHSQRSAKRAAQEKMVQRLVLPAAATEMRVPMRPF